MLYLIVYVYGDYCKISMNIFTNGLYSQRDYREALNQHIVLFTFLEDAPIKYNNSCVYYKFSRFYGHPFRRDTNICSGVPDLKRDRRKMKCGAIEFSNALLRGGMTII